MTIQYDNNHGQQYAHYDGDNPYDYFYEPTPPPQVSDEGTGLFGVIGTLVKDLGKLVGDLGKELQNIKHSCQCFINEPYRLEIKI